jgi:ABC-type multidrug transport system fused ATPase/permease subunit
MKSAEMGEEQLYHKYLLWYIIFFILYFLVAWIFRRTDWPYLYHNIERWIYRRYIPKIIYADNNYIEKIGTGKMISILKEGRKVWMDQISQLIKEITKITITWWFLFYLLYQIDWKYAILLVFWLLVMHILVVWIDTIAHRYRRVRTQEQHELSRRLVRVIMSKGEILQNHSLDGEMQGIEDTIDNISDANDNINKALFFIFNLVRIFTLWVRIVILLVVGYWVFQKTFSLTDFATAMTMVIVFESFLFDSTEFYKNFTKDFSDIEKLWDTLEDAPMLKWFEKGIPFSPQAKDIILKDISYGYNDTKVFSDFSLTIEHGKKTALVGASWWGKTTLMKLIAGYLHPQSWSISIMGNTLSETALKTYYPHIGYLTQDPSVFDGSIRDNLLSALSWKTGEGKTSTKKTKKNVSHAHANTNTLAHTHTSQNTLSDNNSSEEDTLIHALKLAHCDFVFDLDHGLDTQIGERGVRLSWWQKQRLAIAKIFLKDPEIILLDEPTSALDSFSEEQITKALDELFVSRTVIVIAHRLQTVKKADDIIVIEGWGVLERWTHHELVAKWGIYHKMLELQSGF